MRLPLSYRGDRRATYIRSATYTPYITSMLQRTAPCLLFVEQQLIRYIWRTPSVSFPAELHARGSTRTMLGTRTAHEPLINYQACHKKGGVSKPPERGVLFPFGGVFCRFERYVTPYYLKSIKQYVTPSQIHSTADRYVLLYHSSSSTFSGRRP